MMLQTLLDQALASGQVKPSRVGPLKTAVRQYARMFGKDAADLAPDVYHRTPEAIGDWCDQYAPETLGPRGLANLKNNIRWLLALGVEEKWLQPIVGDIVPWHAQHKLPQGRLKRPRDPDDPDVPMTGYRLLLPLDRQPGAPWMRAVVARERENLQLIPDALLAELNAYLAYCKRPFAPDRPAKIVKRDSSAHLTQQAVCAVGGYAAHILGQPLDSLSLKRCTDPDLVNAFVDWWVNTRRGRVTRTIIDVVAHLVTIARYWLKDKDRADALKDIRRALGTPAAVFHKEETVVSLRELERVGRSIYPFNEERLKTSRYARALANYLKDPAQFPLYGGWARTTFTKTAWKAQMSLIIRLLVRIPLRQRNIREMRRDHNLKRNAEGRWEIHFRGRELKVAMRKGEENAVQYLFPEELVSQLDEFLTVWRPFLLGTTPDPQIVFLSRKGKPLSSDHLNTMYTRTVYRVIGKYTTIHLVRHALATYYLDATGDIAGAAARLGDTEKTVWDYYSHILKGRTQDRTGQWLSEHLA